MEIQWIISLSMNMVCAASLLASLMTLLVVVPQVMSHNSEVTDLMPLGAERYVTPATSLIERKLIDVCAAHIIAHPSLMQVTPILFSSPGENWWMRAVTNEGPCVVLLPLHLFVLFPACLCVICIGPLVCVADAWTGPGRSQVTAGPWASPLLFAFDNNGRGPSAVTLHLQWWMAAIVDVNERSVGREESEDGFLYIIFHCMRSFKGFWLMRDIRGYVEIALHDF